MEKETEKLQKGTLSQQLLDLYVYLIWTPLETLYYLFSTNKTPV